MRASILLASLILLALTPLRAQNADSVAIKKFYEENTLLWTGWTTYYKNNRAYPLRDLKKEIIYSPDAMHEFTQYRRNRVWLEVTLIAGTAMLFSAIYVKDQQAKLGLLAGSIIVTTISIPFSFSTSAHLSRAIWLHNRDILLR